jgi:hypothetical protein
MPQKYVELPAWPARKNSFMPSENIVHTLDFAFLTLGDFGLFHFNEMIVALSQSQNRKFMSHQQ